MPGDKVVGDKVAGTFAPNRYQENRYQVAKNRKQSRRGGDHAGVALGK